MKIAQVIILFVPDFTGGASILCANISEALAKKNEVEVFCGRIDPSSPLLHLKKYNYKSVKVTSINTYSFFDIDKIENYYNPQIDNYFMNFIEKFNPDIIHFHALQGLGATLIEIAKQKNIPFTITMHDWWWLCPRLFMAISQKVCSSVINFESCNCGIEKNFLQNRYQYLQKVIKNVKFLVPSNYLKNSLIDNKFNSENILVNENGIFHQPNNLNKITSNVVRFGYLGGGNPLKGFLFLLECFQKIKNENWILKLYGYSNIISLEEQKKCSTNIKFLSSFSPNKLEEILSSIDMVIVPSIVRESFSLVTREAMQYKIPVIASDCGGPEEIIKHLKNGLIFKTLDADSFISCINLVIKEYPDILSHFKENIDIAQIKTIEQQTKELEKKYDIIIKNKQNIFNLQKYKTNCEDLNKINWISEEHHYLYKRKDGFTFYLDKAFLHLLTNINFDAIHEQMNILFQLSQEEVNEMIDILIKLELIKK
ncbi:MAG: glycosyltransferase family 4 protein [bacterium]